MFDRDTTDSTDSSNGVRTYVYTLHLIVTDFFLKGLQCHFIESIVYKKTSTIVTIQFNLIFLAEISLNLFLILLKFLCYSSVATLLHVGADGEGNSRYKGVGSKWKI